MQTFVVAVFFFPEAYTFNQGRIRMLRYAKDPDRLFFTTTLQNSIQAYDLDEGILLDPLNDHPSPPSVFALSSTSHLLLSASTSPIVIQLKNLLLGTRPLTLRPRCSSAAVVVIEFHPERGNIFLLCFADGTCAVYDAAYIFRDEGKGQRRSDVSTSGAGWEVASIRGLHASRVTPTWRDNRYKPNSYSADRPRSAEADERKLGITAAAFVPGHKATVVTVGSDGKCCVLDFVGSNTQEVNVMCTWRLAVAAACLSILSYVRDNGLILPIAGFRDLDHGNRKVLVCVGSDDGQVLLFDLHGNMLLQQAINSMGIGIIDVDWMDGEDWPEPLRYQSSSNVARRHRSTGSRKSIGAVLASHRPVREEVVAVGDENIPNQVSSATALQELQWSSGKPSEVDVGLKPHQQEDTTTQHSPALNHMDIPSLMKELHSPETTHEISSLLADTSGSSSIESMIQRLQFPRPPIHHAAFGKPLQEQDVRQLPRNNSWATGLRPREERVSVGRHHADDPMHGQVANQKSAALGTAPSRSVSDRSQTGVGDLVQNDDSWTDIEPGGNLQGELHAPRGANKPRRRPKHAGEINIHVDDGDALDHPHPLTAHPKTSPTLGRSPLGAVDGNNTFRSPDLRRSQSRQRRKIGNSDSYRSSFYGPGALARQVQQAVMITVNVELDVLRRDMDKKFAAQQEWFMEKLQNSQVWTLRVEEENRKLRDALAKERKRKEGDRSAASTPGCC
ncbi:MAG: hypothetical protein Q9183_003539 [Haloplaca sp. 2 TL-2023]